MGLEKSYTFDDILLVPSYANFEREDVYIGSSLFDLNFPLPIISSPMDTITGIEMARAMQSLGGLGVIHRYQSKEDLLLMCKMAGCYAIAIAPSLGIEFIENVLTIDKDMFLFMDVAHGDTKRNIEFCSELVKLEAKVVSGNIVALGAVERYLKIGVNTFRVGIGSGSICTTRTVAGVGFPQARAIKRLRDVFGSEITIISDGGHKTTGDIIKALALGADFVMLGGMLAGTDEALGSINAPNTAEKIGLPPVSIYRGMASKDAVFDFKGEHDNFIAEGMNKVIGRKGTVVKILKEIDASIRLGCYYTGSRNLKALRNTEVILISENSYIEGWLR